MSIGSGSAAQAGGLHNIYNITSAWAVDREFVNIDWAELGPNFTQIWVKFDPDWVKL